MTTSFLAELLNRSLKGLSQSLTIRDQAETQQGADSPTSASAHLPLKQLVLGTARDQTGLGSAPVWQFLAGRLAVSPTLQNLPLLLKMDHLLLGTALPCQEPSANTVGS